MIIKSLIYITIIAIFFFDWIVFNLNIGSRIITWVPEMCSAILCVYIGFAAAVNKRFHMNMKYLIIIFFYILHIVIGWIGNQVSPGVAFSGIRIYFKYIPFFFLPAVYDFSAREVKLYLIIMLVFSVESQQCRAFTLRLLLSFLLLGGKSARYWDLLLSFTH